MHESWEILGWDTLAVQAFMNMYQPCYWLRYLPLSLLLITNCACIQLLWLCMWLRRDLWSKDGLTCNGCWLLELNCHRFFSKTSWSLKTFPYAIVELCVPGILEPMPWFLTSCWRALNLIGCNRWPHNSWPWLIFRAWMEPSGILGGRHVQHVQFLDLFSFIFDMHNITMRNREDREVWPWH